MVLVSLGKDVDVVILFLNLESLHNIPVESS